MKLLWFDYSLLFRLRLIIFGFGSVAGRDMNALPAFVGPVTFWAADGSGSHSLPLGV
jgi:hypothetical protein